MKITLRIDGIDKVFTTDFIPGRVYRRAIEIQGAVDFRQITPETLDMLVDFVVEAHGKQFTRDQFYDGVDSRKIIDSIIGTIGAIITDTTETLGVDASDPNSQQRA